MHKILLLLLLALTLGCQQAADHTPAASSPNGENSPLEAQAKEDETKPLLLVMQRTHPFSSESQPDYFRLDLRGKSVSEGTVYFTITTREGQLIHEENFPAAALEASMVYEMDKPTATVREREEYIRKRIENFVQPEDFQSPAIAANTLPDTSFVTLSSWNQIQERKNAIGFKYLLGKEDGHLLVYDPEKKKLSATAALAGDLLVIRYSLFVIR